MANQLITSDLVSKMAVATFAAESTFAACANRTYEDMFVKKDYVMGDVINVRQDNFFDVQRGDLVSSQDIVMKSFPVSMQPLYSVMIDFRPTDYDRKFENFQDEVVAPAIRTMAAELNNDIWSAGLTQITDIVGTPTANLDWDLLDELNPKMRSMAIQSAYKKYVSLSPRVAHNLRTDVTLRNSFIAPMNKDIVQQSMLGNLAKFDVFEDDSIRKFEAGTHAAASGSAVTVKNAVTTGNSITLTGLENGTTFKAGDVFQIEGVYTFNRVTRALNLEELVSFVVTTGGTVASNEVTVIVANDIDFTGPRRVMGSASDSIPAGAAVTLFGDHVANYAFNEKSLVLCCPPLHEFPTKPSSTAMDKDFGISIRASQESDIRANRVYMRLDLQAAFRWVPNQAVRLITKG